MHNALMDVSGPRRMDVLPQTLRPVTVCKMENKNSNSLMTWTWTRMMQATENYDQMFTDDHDDFGSYKL